jgi:acetylornithine deacetylase/succinyl-diaminopimelate desuccinylase-like protein
MSDLKAAIEYARSHKSAFIDDLKELLRIPSISTLSEHSGDMQSAANWIADQLTATGHTGIEIIPTQRHPVLYAERTAADANGPTVLVYGHYDVQPVDPIDEWESPPFEPEIRGENLFARGAADMKGQLVEYLKALESITSVGAMPFNIKYLLEGEEEIGSPNLPDFLKRHGGRLKSDLCLNLDALILSADQPSITYALRGLAYFEIRLTGAEADLHSGMYGGVVDNPAQVMCELIAGMRDREGGVLLPGFYDQVRELSDEEREDLASLPQDEKWWRENAGVRELFGAEEYTPTERATARPTLDVNGFLSGFSGEGSKTVLPARAMSKLSMRLVPDQDPAGVRAGLEQYLSANVPSTMSWELIQHAHARPAIIERDSSAVSAAVYAMRQVWEKEPMFERSGGTVPVVSLIKEELGLDTLFFGFGLQNANFHGPNEKLHLPTFERGVEAFIHLFFALPRYLRNPEA